MCILKIMLSHLLKMRQGGDVAGNRPENSLEELTPLGDGRHLQIFEVANVTKWANSDCVDNTED